MTLRSRRELLAEVGTGMIVAGIGTSLAADLGFAASSALADGPDRLTFGDLEPLVAVLQDTPPDRILPLAVGKLKDGTTLRSLVAAAALANARAFGGEDYIGFHTLMALPPAYQISTEDKNPLAVLKVLYRNSGRLAERGRHDVLTPVEPASGDLREAVHKADVTAAEKAFAATARETRAPSALLDAIMPVVDESADVHRVVLAARAWELIDFTGPEQVHALLRQSLRYCVNAEKHAGNVSYSREVREVLPKLLDQFKLLSKSAGTASADDTRLSELADVFFKSTPAQAPEAAAAALADGMSAEAVGEAVCLAANQLVLRDEGRIAGQTSAGKPVGSVHGDGIGVHACDSANAWRRLAKAGNRRTQVTSLILAAYQVARDRGGRGGKFLTWEPYPRAEHLEKVQAIPTEALAKELGGAIRDKDQARATALVRRMGEAKVPASDVFAQLRAFAVSEDGALHAEKYYRTTSEEFAASRPAFRWRQVEALARVTASAYGVPAAGVAEARKLIG